MPIGNRIYLQRNLPDEKLVQAFSTIPVANIADCMERLPAMNGRIRLISNPIKQLVGVALTVKVRAGDNLMLHAALNMAKPGDVIVVSNEGDTKRALIGEVMMTWLKYEKKIAGIIIDGPIRDFEELSQWDLPIYCNGTTPNGPFKNGPGEVNTIISCGEITVCPGDIIVGDADGVIAIPPNDAKEILDKAIVYQQNDSAKIKKTIEGTIDRSWVDRALAAAKTEIIDRVYQA